VIAGTSNMRDAAEQQLIDDEHLRLLRIGYFVAAATSSIFILFPLIYVVAGAAVLLAPGNGGSRWIGVFIAAFGVTISLVMAALTTMKVLTARALRQRRRRTLCLITAGLTGLGFPYGTLLGAATFIVLQRPGVLAQFTE
jgi:hypothetical protein